MSSTRARARRRGGALATVVLLAVAAAAASACAPPPGPPLPAGLTPAPAGTPATSVVDLLGDGYTESEHFFTGLANTYLPAGTLGIDGRCARGASTETPPQRGLRGHNAKARSRSCRPAG